MTVESCFSDDVQNVVGSILTQAGFRLDEIDDDPDSGGRERHVVYFLASDCRVQIYQSSRDGSVNCMIAPLSARNEYGPNAETWQYIRRFIQYPDMPFEELMAAIDAEYDSYPDALHWVAAQLANHLEAARAGIRVMYPPT